MHMNRVLSVFAAAPLVLALIGSPANTLPAAAERAAPRQVLDVNDLETGAPPKLAWSQTDGDTSTIHGPAGATTIDGNVSALAPMGSGFVVQSFDTSDPNARTITRFVGADGTRGRSTWRSGHDLAASPDGKAVAFTVRRGGVRVIDLEGDRVLTMPSIPSREFGSPAHVTGGYCKEDETSNGCAVLVNSTRRHKSWAVSSHGIVDTTP